mgnify:FL=1
MLSNKTQNEKSETFLLAHALLLLVLSLLVGVQGVFEMIDYMPHIISAGCINCGAYVASIPSTLIMYLWFSVSVAVFYYRESKYYFNVIFRFGKETWDMDELEYPPATMSYFCDLIRKDAERLSNLFEAENCEKPIVYKMKFRCKDSKFKFELKYEKDLPSDFQPEQVFIEWKQKIKNKSILLL